MATETLRPTGAGDETNLTPSPAPNWDAVNDIAPDEDATLVLASWYASWYRDFYQCGDILIASGTINKITVYVRARATTNPNWNNLVIPIKTSGGTISESPQMMTTGSWADYSRDWATNPETGNPWTIAEINGLQIGCRMRRPKSDTNLYDTRATQVYLVVDYTPAGAGLGNKSSMAARLVAGKLV